MFVVLWVTFDFAKSLYGLLRKAIPRSAVVTSVAGGQFCQLIMRLANVAFTQPTPTKCHQLDFERLEQLLREANERVEQEQRRAEDE